MEARRKWNILLNELNNNTVLCNVISYALVEFLVRPSLVVLVSSLPKNTLIWFSPITMPEKYYSILHNGNDLRSVSVPKLPHHPQRCYLTEVPRYFNIMPIIVIKLPIDRLHQSFEGSGPQINDERNGPVFQCQVDVVGGFARVQHQAVPLQGLEGQCDFVATALNRVQGQIVAEELRSFEGGNILLFSCRDKKKERGRSWINTSASSVRLDALVD